MDQVIEQPAVEESPNPIVIDHGGDRISEAPPAQVDDSEFQRHKESRGYVKPDQKTDPEPPPLPEAAAEPTETVAPEKKKDERWNDPDTGDTYDMRHKVARRIKTVLGERAAEKQRAEAAERRVEELTRALLERTAPPPAKTEPAADTDPEPNPEDTTKYPEGQYDRAFIRDTGAWAARQENQKFVRTARTEAQRESVHAAEVAELSSWQQTLPEARKRYADFDQVLERIPNTSENAPIVRLMTKSPVGNDLVYVLGTQPKAMEAYRRAPNAESRQRLLYHLEAQLIQRAKASTTRQPATTRAPLPTSPVHAGAGPAGPIDWSRTDDPDQLARWKEGRKRR